MGQTYQSNYLTIDTKYKKKISTENTRNQSKFMVIARTLWHRINGYGILFDFSPLLYI